MINIIGLLAIAVYDTFTLEVASQAIDNKGGEEGLETCIMLCSDVTPNACHVVPHPLPGLLNARIFISTTYICDGVMWSGQSCSQSKPKSIANLSVGRKNKH